MAIVRLWTRSSTQSCAGRRYSPFGTLPGVPPVALRASNDEPHRPSALALPDDTPDCVAARIHFENRP